jgi:probable HAF family extracellular repeat protein
MRGLFQSLLFVLLAGVAACSGADHYKITELETPPGVDSYALAVNNKEQVVGKVNCRAVLWYQGKRTDLGTDGQDYSVAVAINNLGLIAGTAYNDIGCHNPSHAFICTVGMMKDIGYLKRPPAGASGINDLGQVVGTSYDDTGNDRGFVWDSAKGMRDIGSASCYQSTARGINNKGQVVGESAGRAFLWQDGKMTELDNLEGMDHSSPAAINDKGQISGFSGNNTYGSKEHTTRACLWTEGKVIALGTLGGDWSLACAINDRGQVVGMSGISGSELGRTFAHGFIWENGKMVDLNLLVPENSGWVLHEASGINDTGAIVGSGDFKGRTRAFLLTPIVDGSKAAGSCAQSHDAPSPTPLPPQVR